MSVQRQVMTEPTATNTMFVPKNTDFKEILHKRVRKNPQRIQIFCQNLKRIRKFARGLKNPYSTEKNSYGWSPSGASVGVQLGEAKPKSRRNTRTFQKRKALRRRLLAQKTLANSNNYLRRKTRTILAFGWTSVPLRTPLVTLSCDQKTKENIESQTKCMAVCVKVGVSYFGDMTIIRCGICESYWNISNYTDASLHR